MNTTHQPRARILDPDFVYVPAAATDVQATWRRVAGWKPLKEQQGSHDSLTEQTK